MQQDREKWQSIHARRTDPPNALPAFLSPLIPTPGQTEQEYLGRLFHQQGVFYSVAQRDFELRVAVEGARRCGGRGLGFDEKGLEGAVESLLKA